MKYSFYSSFWSTDLVSSDFVFILLPNQLKNLIAQSKQQKGCGLGVAYSMHFHKSFSASHLSDSIVLILRISRNSGVSRTILGIEQTNETGSCMDLVLNFVIIFICGCLPCNSNADLCWFLLFSGSLKIKKLWPNTLLSQQKYGASVAMAFVCFQKMSSIVKTILCQWYWKVDTKQLLI